MTPTDAAQLQIVEVELAEADTLIVVARCLAGTTRPGTRFRRVRNTAQPINLTVTELWRYPGLQVKALDAPHAARVILTGTGGDLLRPADLIQDT
ncbi:hypothetical protein GCM10023176_41080 [Micromonospora coerulea]|uniref:Uncharacterized protein n=1 Tax=Micromonospora coerulea TaxID=47856 RepID=A0ABP8SRK3_9ACTN